MNKKFIKISLIICLPIVLLISFFALTVKSINDEHFEEMANNLCKEDGYLNGYRKLNKEDILSIYQQCL